MVSNLFPSFKTTLTNGSRGGIQASTNDDLLIDNDFCIKSDPYQLFRRRQVKAVNMPGSLDSSVSGLEWSPC